jgi:Bacterial archaeo-eukaryotic release factor family 3
LIPIEDGRFPVQTAIGVAGPLGERQLQESARVLDAHFGHYYARDPLELIVVGERELLCAFTSVTAHGAAIRGRAEGDHTSSTPRDLGQIVWPLVKEAMSGLLERTMRSLDASGRRGQVASGLEAVASLAREGVRATLLVEDDYQLRGSVSRGSQSPVISPDVDVRDAIDDAVDAVIERVLESGGDAVFAPSGSLSDHDRIVLLLRGAEGS